MAKLIYIAFASFYLFFSVGVRVNYHYCGENLKEIGLYGEAPKCEHHNAKPECHSEHKCCHHKPLTKETVHNNCCNDESLFASINEQNTQASFKLNVLEYAPIYKWLNFNLDYLIDQEANNLVLNKGDPPLVKDDLFALYCAHTFYG